MAEAIKTKRPERIRLGDLLLQQKLISQEQLKGALEDQTRSGRKLGRVLIESGYLSEDQIGEALARQLGVPFINLKYYNFNSAVIRKLPEAQARRFRALVLEEQDDMVLVAMVDPTDLFAFDEISRLTRKEVNIAVASETLLLQTIDRIYRRTDQISSLAKELGEDLGDVVDFGTLTLGAGMPRSSSCCRRCSRTQSGHGPPTSTSNRTSRDCTSASGSTASCSGRPRPTPRYPRRWRNGSS